MSISLFMLGCSGSYTGSVICAVPHTVGDKIKFRIPFHRTAIPRLKNGGKTIHRLVKSSRSIRPALILIFLVHPMPHSKKL